MFFNLNKSENFTPGFVAVLHTFGRDLKWNPHIHILCTEGGAGNNKYKKLFASFYKWRALILSCFQYDPIQCPCCKKTMTLMLIRFNKGKETPEEHYARIMNLPPWWKPS